MSTDVREPLTLDEAVALLPDGDDIHTLRGGGGMMLGADWSRREVIAAMAECGVEKAGPMATAMGHGLVLHDPKPLFIATKERLLGALGRDDISQ
jgi:hypothetical protein